ncbi:glycosyltransferase [Burkholderia singularis]|uniref:glycosyltransferase n=1 Tax=Burkholderia singularis TaxID=1503053 RepID=UPI001FE12913|nr:glycosyltransferase [Burkholderia singularis]
MTDAMREHAARILQITPYPTIDPRHGGQIRSAQIAAELRAAGYEVKSVAVYVADDYPQAGEDDIAFDSKSEYWHDDLPWLSDYYSGVFGARDVKASARLQAVINGYRPQAVVVEQPWLFKAVQRVAPPGTKLIYSSQNIEWRLKDKLFARTGHPQRQTLIEAIREMEHAAARDAHLVVACTESDLAYYRDVSGKPAFNGVVAGNGVEPFSCTPQRVAEWLAFFSRPIPVFVSSAHLPNAQGFWDMMAPGLTFLRPDEDILVVGGVSSIIMQAPGYQRYADVNLSRLNIAGPREKTELQALVRASHVVLLPITDGEGSNLKTAEALESGCPIVATSKAFRGFEAAMSLPHVQIADNARDFRVAVRRALDRPRKTDATPLEVRSKYYWKHQLKGFVEAMRPLSEARATAAKASAAAAVR